MSILRFVFIMLRMWLTDLPISKQPPDRPLSLTNHLFRVLLPYQQSRSRILNCLRMPRHRSFALSFRVRLTEENLELLSRILLTICRILGHIFNLYYCLPWTWFGYVRLFVFERWLGAGHHGHVGGILRRHCRSSLRCYEILDEYHCILILKNETTGFCCDIGSICVT